MAATPPTSDPVDAFDSSRPLHGVVLCCTSIAPDLRAMIDRSTKEMGGVHKYDLTPDATHLLVGEYDTPKYRHVAKERPDIVPMAAGWIEALRALWMADQEIDFAALQQEWRLKTFETGGGIPSSTVPEERDRQRLLCCLTGFEDHDVRTMIEDKVKSNGGDYTGDLSKSVTHLITYAPEGKKYRAAKNWDIHTVSIEWLHDSVERGMILSEVSYDPVLSPAERGKDAWTRKEVRPTSLGKRARENSTTNAAEGRRKLRKSASMKLSSQRDNLWGDILTNRSSTDLAIPPALGRTESMPVGGGAAVEAAPSPALPPPLTASMPATEIAGPIFGGCRFYVHGFSSKRLNIVKDHLVKNGAEMSSSITDLASPQYPEPLDQRFLLVPQNSQPDTHPICPEGPWVVTEFYIERCIQGRELVHPGDHVLGRPFPRFPVERFSQLVICTSGFQDLQLNQVQKTIIQLGAEYAERLNARASLLVCCSLSTARKEKLDHAVSLKIPVVTGEWLWQCISVGVMVPWSDFMFPELKQNPTGPPSAAKAEKSKLQRSKSVPAAAVKHSSVRLGMDKTAFDACDLPTTNDTKLTRNETAESYYQTAPAFQDEQPGDGFNTEPLTEVAPNALNGSRPSFDHEKAPRKLKRFPTGGEIGDSEESEPPTQTPASAVAIQDIHSEQAKAEQDEREAKTIRAKQEMSKRLNSLLSHDSEHLDSDGSFSVTKPARRKREILGRAQSNVSTASSASADSSAAAPVTAKVRKLKTATIADGDPSMGRIFNAYNQDQDLEIQAAPATQLEYVDSEAKKHRAAIESKLNGDKNAPVPRDSQEDRVTMADFKGYGRTEEANAIESGTTGRRTMRRR